MWGPGVVGSRAGGGGGPEGGWVGVVGVQVVGRGGWVGSGGVQGWVDRG